MTSTTPSHLTSPVSNLPPELRHKIYAEYFRPLNPILITHSTITSLTLSTIRSTVPTFIEKLHSHIFSQTPLALAAPIFAADIPLNVILSNLTFSFTCARVLKIFSSLLIEIKTKIRSVQISYGPLGRKTADWVFLIASCFPDLEEVVFVIDNGKGEGCCDDAKCVRARVEMFGNWWKYTRDAMRESIDVRHISARRRNGMLLSVQNEKGVEIVSERVGVKSRK